MTKPISIFVSSCLIFAMIALFGCSRHSSATQLEISPFDQKQYGTPYSYQEEGQLYDEVASIVEDAAKMDALFGKPVTVESVREEGDDYAEVRTYNGISIRRWDTKRSPYVSKGLIGIEAWGPGTPVFRNLKIGDTLADISARLARNDNKPTNQLDVGYKYLYYVKGFTYARIEPDDPDFHCDMLVVQDDTLRYRIYLDEDGRIVRFAVNNTY